MTKQTKIPLPPHDGQPQDEAAVAGKQTLIERVVRNYDLVKLGPPPIPEDLFADAGKRAGRYRRQVDADALNAGPEPAPEAAQPAVRPSMASEKPLEIDAEFVDAPPPRLAAQPLAPVRFSGTRHPIDRQHLRDQGLIVPEGSVTGLLEEFRIVKRQLLLASAELSRQGMGLAAQRVLICSPHPGEGKTYTAVNLALSIAAEKDSEVLLVDADFAKPSVLSALGLPGGPGLMDALADPSIDVADCVIGTDVPGLWVLPAGNATNSDSEYLSSARTSAVLDRLTKDAPNRFVIFDSPPVLAASPAAELAKYVGQAALVVRADRTGQGALEDAISLLSGCPNIQLLLNAVHFSPSGRRFGSYYGYGG
jgi:Mrp family chromosome partitioning ATPase